MMTDSEICMFSRTIPAPAVVVPFMTMFRRPDGAVDSVVRRHDALCAALLNTSAERLEIQLICIPRVKRRVLPAAADLGVVSIEVFQG